MDTDVRFDKDLHKYYIDGAPMKDSVTTVVHHYFEKFDGVSSAKAMLRGASFWTNEERYGKYWDAAKEVSEEVAIANILAMWEENRDESAGLGTAMHEAIEEYLVNGTPLPDTKECRMFSNFLAYAQSLGYQADKMEEVVWDVKASIAGSVDMQFKHSETGHTWLVDWKRSKEIKTKGFRGKKGLGPMSNKQDCNFEHYSLQLNIYKYLLTHNKGRNIERMSIVVLHPNQDDYMLLDVDDNQEAVVKILRERI